MSGCISASTSSATWARPLAMLFTPAFIPPWPFYFGLVGWLLGRLGAGLPRPWWLLLLPAAWTSVEWLRGWLLTGFPGWPSGYSRGRAPGLRALAGGRGERACWRCPPPCCSSWSSRGANGCSGGGLLLALWLGWLLRQVSSDPAQRSTSRWAWQANIPSLKWDQ